MKSLAMITTQAIRKQELDAPSALLDLTASAPLEVAVVLILTESL